MAGAMGGSGQLRVGTRGSRLALAQTQIVVDLIRAAAPGTRVAVVPIRTAGDIAQAGEASGADRKFAFTHEIDRQLIEGRVDVAVHSLKDLPSSLDRRLTIAATPPRGDVRDALVSLGGSNLGGLPIGSVVGTSSIRRKVQLSKLRPDIRAVEVRGNVETRMERMREKGLDGVVVAAAGLQRLGLAGRAAQHFTVDEMVPAACQGILAVESRKDDEGAIELLKKVDDQATNLESSCERAFLARLGGDCNFPAGAYAKITGVEMKIVGMVAEPDGSSVVKSALSGPKSGPDELGKELARRLLRNGGRRG
ncbi:MAG: hydroxymethylbilane synthase [Nitrososphaerota archaeon]|nr:hydroxymethylbilane synthase [Nitrososphaerota archaeon]